LSARPLSVEKRRALHTGIAIPAHPLALDGHRRFDERHQRALTRYYLAAGARGLAVGVHTRLRTAEPSPLRVQIRGHDQALTLMTG